MSALDKLKRSARDGIYEALGEVGLYDSEIYGLDVWVAIDNELNKIFSDDKFKDKLIKNVSKTLLAKHKENECKAKAEYAKNKKLWKVSKGKIPCLNGCGYVDEISERDVLSGHHLNYICKNCSDKIGDNWSEISKIFDSNNIYKIYGIE